jgi:hypothetical protein
MGRLGRILAAALAILTLTGCSGMSYQELYCLPKATEDAYDLQEALSQVLEDGYNYLSPTSGLRQEPIQRMDLDGDGVSEAVAFFRSASDGAVAVYIFDKADAEYLPTAVIEGAGLSVAAVEYADLDGCGAQELILTYQVSETVTQALQVYRYDGASAENIYTGSCSQYRLTDLNQDGRPELISLLSAGSDSPATVESFDGQDKVTCALSFSYDNLTALQTGVLSDGTPAILVTGQAENPVTDVFVNTDNFQPVETQGRALSTAQGLLPTDVDGDGLFEFPVAEVLPGEDTDETVYVGTRWYSLSAEGKCRKKLLTYQDTEAGWTFTLPAEWDGKVLLKAAAPGTGISAMSFYRADNAERILTLYTVSGAGRQSYVENSQLAILHSYSDVTYGVDIHEAAETWPGTLTLAQVSEAFQVLREDQEE